MIVATAGHVDHGKTELIKALTGIDTDRLPEEKKRGLSIDLGFAYQPLADGSVLGFVDVPGHERFIRNMLAGVAGIDLGLLVVAADDGVMPQTREHAAILKLLGIEQCLVAVTKIDRVDEARAGEVEGEVEALLVELGLSALAAFRVCAPRGLGIEALRAALFERAAASRRRTERGFFRLSVDRCFSLQGVGVVVTGTIFSGRVRTGDRLLLSPKGAEVRVRAMRAQNVAAEEALAGDRCALNLAGRGLSGASVKRGDWVLERAVHLPTRRMDAEVRVLASEERKLRHWTPVHVHLAAAHVTGRVAVLAGGSIAPGESGLTQLVLDEDVVCVWGDRLVLRDQSAQRTIAGGTVVDPLSPARGRARPARLEWLAAMHEVDHRAALAGLLSVSTSGVVAERFQRTRNIDDEGMRELLSDTEVERVGKGEELRLVEPGHWSALEADVVRAVGVWHEAHPDFLGPEPHELRASLAVRPNEQLLESALAELVSAGRLVRRGLVMHLPGHRARLGPEDARRWPKVRQSLSPRKGSPLSLRQAAEELRMEAEDLDALLRRATRAGFVVPIAKNRYVPLAPIRRWAEVAAGLAGEARDGMFSAAEFRDAAEIGRNFAIDLLEFFDRSGLTERIGDRRRVKRSAEEAFGAE